MNDTGKMIITVAIALSIGGAGIGYFFHKEAKRKADNIAAAEKFNAEFALFEMEREAWEDAQKTGDYTEYNLIKQKNAERKYDQKAALAD